MLRTLDIARAVAVTFAVLLALCVHGGGLARAATGDAPPFDALPAAGSYTDERESYFVIPSRPGTPVRQQITLTNRSKAPVTFVLGTAEATTGPLGGVTYSVVRQGDRAPRIDWLELSEHRVRLAAGATRIVPFLVQMPHGADAGDHLAGITIERATPPKRAAGTAKAGASAAVTVRSRRVIAVQVTVPGPTSDELQIEGVRAAPQADGMYLMVELRNTGTTLLKARGTIEMDADPRLDEAFEVDTFVPRTTIEYPIRWTQAPSAGQHDTEVEVTYEGQSVRWSGTVRVGDRELKGFDDRTGADTASDIEAWILWVAGAAAVVVLAAAYAWRRRRADRDFVDTSGAGGESADE